MADDVYRRVREVRIAALTNIRSPNEADTRKLEALSRGVRFVRRRRSEEDYSAFKAALAPEFEAIKLQIRLQHEQTRAEVQTTRADVLAAVKASPAEYVKLACEFGALFFLLSLAIRFTLKIELVNPGFALFMLFCLAVYWSMARLKEASDKRGTERPLTCPPKTSPAKS